MRAENRIASTSWFGAAYSAQRYASPIEIASRFWARLQATFKIAAKILVFPEVASNIVAGEDKIITMQTIGDR